MDTLPCLIMHMPYMAKVVHALAIAGLQNHVLGRLSINQSLMSGGSVWFIRKRCALSVLSVWCPAVSCAHGSAIRAFSS